MTSVLPPPLLALHRYERHRALRFSGTGTPPPPYFFALAMGALAAVLAFLLSLVSGCGAASSLFPPVNVAPRVEWRARVSLAADGVNVANHLCKVAGHDLIAHGRADDGIAMLSVCADAYDATRPALVAAADAVDAWDDMAEGRVRCALVSVARGLRRIVAELAQTQNGTTLGVVDAVALVAAIEADASGEACPR